MKKNDKPPKAEPGFTEYLFRKAWDRYHAPHDDKYDFPPYALTSWDDRVRWSEFLKKVGKELEAKQ